MKGKLRHGALALTGVALVLAAGAAEAGAAQRFVAQGGTGVSCSQPDPCSIETGINDATANDEVIVAPGDYSITTQMANSNNGLDIHGQPGGERPTITSGVAFGTGALKLDGAGVEVADLSIRALAPFGTGLFVFSTGALVERVDVLASGSSGEACRGGPNMTFRDSLCVATGSGATAFVDAVSGSGTFSSKLRNSTLITTGATSTALRINAGSGITDAVDAKNVIAWGVAADVAVEAAVGATATLSLTNSNYLNATTAGAGTATVTAAGTGTNQTDRPNFADTTAYHQDPRSPTVDAGVIDPDIGASDLDGDPRALGSAPDIGVDEYVPPDPPNPPNPPNPPTPPKPPAADSTPPETTIDSGPKKRTRSKKARFEFSSSEPGSTFVCRLDKKVAAPCTSPLKLKRLKKGGHKLRVTATDGAGNADATPATYSWKVKRKKPKG